MRSTAPCRGEDTGVRAGTARSGRGRQGRLRMGKMTKKRAARYAKRRWQTLPFHVILLAKGGVFL